MNYFKNCITLDDARKLYRKLVLKLHPDRGGEHFAFVKMREQFEKFKPDANNYKYRDEYEDWRKQAGVWMHIIEKLIQYPMTITIAGNWVWIKCDKKHKDIVKGIDLGDQYKVGWSRNKSMWYYSPKSYRKMTKKVYQFDEIKDMFGSKSFKGSDEDSKKRKTNKRLNNG